MGAALSDQFRCCITRGKEQRVSLRISPPMLTCNTVEAVPATMPKSNGCAHDGQGADSVLEKQTQADGSDENVSVSTSMASRSTGIQDVTRPCETTSVEVKTNTNAIERETQGNACLPQETDVGQCDKWTIPEVLERCDSLTYWYSSPEVSGYNRGISANGQETAKQAKANRSLSNWYTENNCAEMAPPPPTHMTGFVVLWQAPCHYYHLSSHVDEPAVSNHDETPDNFRLVQGGQLQVEGSVAAMNKWHPMAPSYAL